MLLPVQDKNSKMERSKNIIVGLVLTSLLAFSVVPYFNVRAQTCDPDALVPVSYGQRGSAVRNAQACLIEAGYDIPAGATGYYGSQTRNAVREFYADWYGAWSGNSLGPRGIAELKSRLAAAPSQPSQPTQPTTGVSQEQLQQVLTLLSQGKTTEALLLLLALLGGQQPTTTPTTPTTAEEGFLTVEQDPSVVAVTLREGETGKVFGLRMRADNGDVTVQSVFLRWATTSNAAPFRTISKIEVVDEQGNVLFSRNVDNTTFYQDSSLNYYLPVTGLNFRVPKNTYKSLFVQVTVVGTLPSNVNTAGFYVNANDVRGVDGAGVQRFAPSGTISQNFTLQPAIAGQAEWVVARNVNTPKEGYLFGSTVDGKLYNQKVLSIDVTAKYDSLRMTQVSGSVSGNATVTAVYLRHGSRTLASSPVSSAGSFTFNVTPANFTVNQDQTVTLDIYADFANGTTTEATSSVTVTDVYGLNSLGDNRHKPVSVASDVMHYLTVGPQFVFKTPTTQYTPPSIKS
jgi:peptidoglycan hydrolase-like protein with peptidoglycan-binding domain